MLPVTLGCVYVPLTWRHDDGIPWGYFSHHSSSVFCMTGPLYVKAAGPAALTYRDPVVRNITDFLIVNLNQPISILLTDCWKLMIIPPWDISLMICTTARSPHSLILYIVIQVNEKSTNAINHDGNDSLNMWNFFHFSLSSWNRNTDGTDL